MTVYKLYFDMGKRPCYTFSPDGNPPVLWRDGRVDDCDGLENRSGRKLTGGSNPSPSASNKRMPDI